MEEKDPSGGKNGTLYIYIKCSLYLNRRKATHTPVQNAGNRTLSVEPKTKQNSSKVYSLSDLKLKLKKKKQSDEFKYENVKISAAKGSETKCRSPRNTVFRRKKKL